MTTPYEENNEIITLGFENYLDQKLIRKWKDKYFPYSTVKSKISVYFQNFMKDLKKSEVKKGTKRSKKMKFIFFKDNKIFIKSINKVVNLIKREFTKVTISSLI
jgi:hypothetical protein